MKKITKLISKSTRLLKVTSLASILMLFGLNSIFSQAIGEMRVYLSLSSIEDDNNNGIVDVGDILHFDSEFTNIGSVGTYIPCCTFDVGETKTLIDEHQHILTPSDLTNGFYQFSISYTILDLNGNSIVETSDAGDDSVETPDGYGVVDMDPTNDPTVVQISALPSILLEKDTTSITDTNMNGLTDAGDIINYTFTVTNTGSVDLENVLISDPLLEQIGISDLDGNNIGDLAADAVNTNCTGMYIIQPDDMANTDFENIATVTGNDASGVQVMSSSSIAVPLDVSAELRLYKTVSSIDDTNMNGLNDAGDVIHYAFEINNLSNVPIENISVTDPLATVVGSAISLEIGESDNSTFTGTYTILPADMTIGYVENSAKAEGVDPQNNTIQDISDAGDDLIETADGDGTTDMDPTNDPTIVMLDLMPSITITKDTTSITDVNTNGIVDFGDVINYTFEIENTGNTILTNVTVTDALLQGSNGTLSGSPIASLAIGAIDNTTYSGTYTIQYSDMQAGSVSNTASVTAEDPMMMPVNATSNTITAAVEPYNASIQLYKYISGTVDNNANTLVDAGDQINYTFTLNNNGNIPLTNIDITDPLLAGIPGELYGSPIATLAPGASDIATFTGEYIIQASDMPNGFVQNSATATAIDALGMTILDNSDAGDDTVETPDGEGNTDVTPNPTNDPTVQVLDLDCFNDTTPPVCLTQIPVVYLDANGEATIVAADVDNGSYDFCGGPVSVSINPTTFICDDVSPSISAWENVGMAGISEGGANRQELVLDSEDNLYVVYKDNFYGGRTTVLKYDGSSWAPVGIPGFGDEGNDQDIAIDSNDKLYVTYNDPSNGGGSTVMTYNGTAWVLVGSKSFGAGNATQQNIAIDSNNKVYVAYRDEANGFKSTVMTYNGSSWELVGTAGFSAGGVFFLDFAIDSNNNLYVVYQNGGNTTVMTYNGTSWQNLGMPKFGPGNAGYHSIAIDSDDKVYVSFEDRANGNRMSVMTYNGASWENVGMPGFSDGGVISTSLAVDSEGNLFVAYRDVPNGAKTTVKRFNGGTWESVGPTGFTTGGTNDQSLIVDANDNLFVAFTEGPTTVMQYQFPQATTTLTITDNKGNTTTCEAYVTVLDNIAPTTNCQATFEVQLDATGNGTVNNNDVLAIATDNCDLTVTPYQASYTCDDLDVSSLSFDGIDDRVELSGFNLSGTFTIEAWVSPNEKIDFSTILSNKTGGLGNSGFTFAINSFNNSDRVLLFESQGVSAQSDAGIINWSQWQHVAVTYDGSILRMYLNGSEINVDIPTNINLIPSLNSTFIGDFALYFGDGNFKGLMDELRIWNAARTAEEIVNNMNLRLAGDEAGLVAHYNFNEGSGLILTDNTGNGYDGTIEGAAYEVSTPPSILTFTDPSGNSATCSTTFVVSDTIKPTAICKDITVYLDDLGKFEITPDTLNNNSSDNCDTLVFSANKTMFSCSDVSTSPVEVTLMVIDASGNFSTCTSNVTVLDTFPPVPICYSPYVVQLDASGFDTIQATDLDAGSYDNCGPLTFAIQDSVFDCWHLGLQIPVTLTVTDASGNSSSCITIIEVEDNIAPVANCNAGVTVYLDVNGQGTLTPEEVNNGSTDACGVATTTLSKSTFNCSDLGLQNVDLTVTDISGNTNSCSTTVTVVDEIGPNCPVIIDQVIQLAQGECDALAVFTLPNAATDNCDNTPTIEAIPGELTSGMMLPIGTHVVNYKITDNSGNSTICSFRIIIREYTPASMECHELINFSLDSDDCVSSLTADIILVGTDIGCLDSCKIRIYDEYNKEVPNEFTYLDLGKTFDYTITCGGNTCGGKVLIEDKVAPKITVQTPVEITCVTKLTEDIHRPIIYDVCGGTVVLKNQEYIATNCDPDNRVGYYLRTWQAVDYYGNTSPEVIQQVNVKRVMVGSAVVVPNVSSTNKVSCAVVGFDEVVPVNLLGVPTLGINGPGLYPFTEGLICNGYSEFTDRVVSQSPCLKTIERKWEVGTWWCNGTETKTAYQMIEIRDDVAPVLQTPLQNMNATTDTYSCEATVNLPKANFTDGCSSLKSVRANWDGPDGKGFIDTNGGSAKLPVGTHTVVYMATDLCDNTSTASMVVKVIDDVDPIAICKQNTVASIVSNVDPNGTTYVDAEDIDNGSFDECSPVKLQIRKVEDLCGNGDEVWKDRVHFCCDEVNTPVMVFLMVTDSSGNSNTCMVVVTPQDKIVSTMNIPADMTLECDYTFDPDSLSNFFGAPVVTGGGCTELAVVTELPDFQINSCGTGYISRTFTLTQPNAGPVSATQVIKFENNNKFDESDIVWPKDTIFTDVCMPDTIPPSIAGEPILNDGRCDQAAFTYEDKDFRFGTGGTCVSYIREWTVIDWCQKENNKYLEWNKTQKISTVNTKKPVLTVPAFFEFKNDDAACGPMTLNNVMVASATDDCTELSELQWTYKVKNASGITVKSGISNAVSGIFANGDYTVDYTVMNRCNQTSIGSATFRVLNAKAPVAYAKNISTQLVGVGSVPVKEEVTVNASQLDNGSYHSCGYGVVFSFSSDTSDNTRTYSCDSIGRHKVEFWVTDLVHGNQSHVTGVLIDVVDDNDVFICPGVRLSIAGIFDGDTNGNGFAEVGETITFSYILTNTGGTTLMNVNIPNVISIDSLPVGADSLFTSFYTLKATDIANESVSLTAIVSADGVNDYQSSTIVELPINPNRVAQIEGRIATEDDRDVVETMVTLENSEFSDAMTDDNGHYAFPEMAVGGAYAVNPHKDGDDLNGVSTLDVVMIQRHILGLDKLESPFKLIAADINKDDKISASDLVQLRKVILGITSGFPDNTSWRFVDKTFEFYDAQDPFLGPIQEQYIIDYFDDNMSVDFVGVKVGDINGSVNPELIKSKGDDNRNQSTVNLLFDDQIIGAGNTYMIPVYAEDFIDVAGFQYTIEMNGLQFAGIETGAIDLTVDNLGFSNNMDKINVSWNSKDLMSIEEDLPLFTLVVLANTDGELNNMISVNSSGLSAEIYQSEELNTNRITLEKRNSITENNIFMMYQNSPNPFKAMSEIEFTLPNDGNVNFTIYDVTGKELMNKSIVGNKGFNYLMIDKNEINTTGVVYYKMTYNNQSLTKKMIIIE